MSKLILLWMTLAISTVFLIWKELGYSDQEYSLFPFSDQVLTVQMYVWYICARFIYVVMAWIILQESNEYRGALWVFFGIHVFRFTEFFFNYNEVWFYLWGTSVPITSNLICILVFSLAIAFEMIWKDYGSTS